MRITRVVFDVSMRFGFPGLREIAKKTGVKLDQDSTVVFINTKVNAFKMLHKGEYLVYYRHPERHKIPIDAIRFLPKFFRGTRMEMDEAIKQSLSNKLGIEIRQLDQKGA